MPASSTSGAGARTRVLTTVAAVLAVVVVAGVVLQLRAQADARQEATLTAARFALGVDVRERRTALAGPTSEASDAAASLRLVLLEYVTASERGPAEVTAERDRLEEQLSRSAAALRGAAAMGVPSAPAALDPAVVTPLLREVADLQAQAVLLADEVDGTLQGSERWGSAVAALIAANGAYAAAATDPADLPSEPARVAERWTAEVAPLEAYVAAAEAAGEIPGLTELAAAHRDYAAANLAWAREAAALLAADEVETYNTRLAEVTAEGRDVALLDDLTAATAAAASSPTLEAVDVERRRLLSFLRALDALRRHTATRLAPPADTDS